MGMWALGSKRGGTDEELMKSSNLGMVHFVISVAYHERLGNKVSINPAKLKPDLPKDT